jgi:hypothetical protein
MINDIIGYTATAVTLFSFTQATVLRIRLVNSIGAILWMVYGILIVSYPNLITNSLILIIHLGWFIKNRKTIFI